MRRIPDSCKPPSPSPWPSPAGRGNTGSRAATSRGALDWRRRGERFSLSPRERAGVRGKPRSKHQCACELPMNSTTKAPGAPRLNAESLARPCEFDSPLSGGRFPLSPGEIVAARSAGVRAVPSKPSFGMEATARAGALLLLLLSTLLYPLLAGCAQRQPRADLVIANGAEPESLDPAVATGQPDLRAIAALFEGLTRYNAQSGEPEPGWAERWEISPDGRRYKFFLRANSVWSTGEPLTAEDFVYSWRRVLDPATAAEYAGQLFYVKNAEAFRDGKLADPSALGIRALDARTLEVELAEPTAFFLSLCAFQTLAVVPRDVIERLGDRWLMQRPLKVSGAYTLEAWRLNDKIRLRKNPRYWDAANTELAVVDLLPLTSPGTALNLYETHAVDLVWDKSLVPTELVERLLKRPDFHTFPYLGSYFVRFNVTRKPFDDARVRKAFTQVIDKRRLVEKITKGGEKPARTHVPPGTANYQPPEGLAYDPAAGRRLLAAAGYPGGKGFPNVVYLYNAGRGGGRQDDQLAIELQAMWQAELGVTVELRA